MESKLISSPAALRAFLDEIDEETAPAVLYVDLEGTNLSRHGRLSLITILLERLNKVHLVDVTQMQSEAFTTASTAGQTLKGILESKNITKVFFDIRNDSDALFSLYGVRVDGIEDLQLMELASRNFNRTYVNGLAKCIERDADITYSEKVKWRKIKELGQMLFDPERGGSYAVFDERPLLLGMETYCCQDVTLMPHLRNIYRRKLCDAWWRKIQVETAERIKSSQHKDYNGKGKHKAMGPPSWINWSPTWIERQSQTFLGDSVTINASKRTTESRGASPLEQCGTDHGIISDSLQALSLTAARTQHRHTSPWEPEDMDDCYDDDDDDDDDGDESPRDLTACDSECGYCGRCDY